MKCFVFVSTEWDNGANIAQAADKAWASAPPQIKLLARYLWLGIAFPGQNQGELLAMNIVEAETGEAVAAILYPVSLAGAKVTVVPVMELPIANAAELEKKYRG
jgi:hypothetical protein